MNFEIASGWTILAVLAGWFFFAAAGSGAEFPSVDELPERPEMPDPLVMFDGSPVASVDDWTSKRQPELAAQFQHYMYGNLPAAPAITATVDRIDRDALGGKATMKQLQIAFGPPDCPPIQLLLLVPNRPTGGGRSPVVLGLSFTGNHTVLDDKRIALTRSWMREGPGVENNRATEAARGTGAGQWEVEHTIDRGYALATFYYGDVMPDKPDLNGGVLPFFRNKDANCETPPNATSWGAIAAWAWGLQRAVDYLVTDADLDAKRIVVFGHSRNGKAALLAGAFDPRIAAVIPHQAGCGGTAPSRRRNPKGESVTLINERFPHWFDGVFKTFNGREDRLPFDQNCLVALCFPRAVLLTNGTADQWADPPGQWDVLRSASTVYERFGQPGLGSEAQPQNDKLIGQRLCYFIREAPHSVDKVYWDVFLDFADKVLEKR